MDGLIDPEAPYPDGCGPDCKGCDPCTCGHPWSDHKPLGDKLECWHPVGDHVLCACRDFDALCKPHIAMPSLT